LAEFGTGVGFGTTTRVENESANRDSVIQTALKRAFSPEFLNRIDDVVVFNSLDRSNIHSIIDLELKSLVQRIEGLGYGIEVTEKAKDFLVDQGYDEKYGARPLKRAIQKHLEDPFAEEIINANIQEGDSLKADYKKGGSGLIISVVKGGFLSLPEGASEALKEGTEQEANPGDSKQDDSQG
jgi:ATP-dependent Clp protease ATP-binding subunit ClpC